MGSLLDESLFIKQPKRFDEVKVLARHFTLDYCGNTIIRDSIFGVVSNYARKRELPLEILRYPFKDNELWAFTFVKKGIIFLCVNSDLEVCKQIFAVAHELYHIHCYADDKDPDTITSGSLLDSRTVDDKEVSQEDLEANAFAGLLLMPDERLDEQIKLYDIDSSGKIAMEDVLTLMDLFALPYKAVVLRLLENKNIKYSKALEFIEYDNSSVSELIKLTGKARAWQQNTHNLKYYGDLLSDMEYNSDNGLLTDSREMTDKEYLDSLDVFFSDP